MAASAPAEPVTLTGDAPGAQPWALEKGQIPAETIAAGLVSCKKEGSDVGQRPQGGGKWRKKGRCVVCEVECGVCVCGVCIVSGVHGVCVASVLCLMYTVCVWYLYCVWCSWCVCGVCIVSDVHGVCVWCLHCA